MLLIEGQPDDAAMERARLTTVTVLRVVFHDSLVERAFMGGTCGVKAPSMLSVETDPELSARIAPLESDSEAQR